MARFDLDVRSGEVICERWIEIIHSLTHRRSFFEGWIMEQLADYEPEAVWYFTAPTARAALKKVRAFQEEYS